MGGEGVTRERVLEAALTIVETEGADALTMRALAAKLGVAVTAIYWHVGNKQQLLAALVDRIGTEVGRVTVTGRTPAARVLSAARSLRRNLVVHRDLVALTNEQGRNRVVFVPARRALAEAFAAGGLRGARLANAAASVLHLVVGSVLIERAADRAPVQRDAGALWDGAPPVDRTAAARLAEHLDPEQVFDVALEALVRGLLNAG